MIPNFSICMFVIMNKDYSKNDRPDKNGIDMVLFLLIAILLIFGFLAVYSASQPISSQLFSDKFFLAKKHLYSIIAGFAIMILFSKVNYKSLSPLRFLFLICALAMLLFTTANIFSPSIAGSHRWIRIGPLFFLATPLVEFFMLIYLTSFLDNNRNNLDEVRVLLMAFSIIFIPSFLMLRQPNVTASILFVSVTSIIIFVAGVKLTRGLSIFFILYLPFFLGLFSFTYRRQRLLAFWDPRRDSSMGGYQIIQSFIGLGGGKLFGVGFGEGILKYYYLPDIHSSFILSNIGEELGFAGTFLVIILLLGVALRGFVIAFRARDTFGKLLATGITSWIAVYSVCNIACVTGLIPTTGANLPFISYGGSFIILQLLAAGVLLNISKTTGKYTNYWQVGKGYLQELNPPILNKVKDWSQSFESHPYFKLLGVIALIITTTVSMIQLIIWIWFK